MCFKDLMGEQCNTKHFYVQPSARGNGQNKIMFRFNESTHGCGRHGSFVRSLEGYGFLHFKLTPQTPLTTRVCLVTGYIGLLKDVMTQLPFWRWQVTNVRP